MEITPKSSSFLKFSAGGTLYGIRTSNILGIVQSETVTPLPHTPPSVLGIIELRGTLCTVVDLSKHLHGSIADCIPPFLLLSLLYREYRVCAVVDQVLSVFEIDPNELLVPKSPNGQAGRFVTAFAAMNDDIIQILSVEKLFDSFSTGIDKSNSQLSLLRGLQNSD